MGAQRANLSTVCGILSFVFCFVFPKLVTVAPEGINHLQWYQKYILKTAFLIYTGKSLNQKTGVSDIATELTQSTIKPNSDG